MTDEPAQGGFPAGGPDGAKPGWYRSRTTGQRRFWNGTTWNALGDLITPFPVEPPGVPLHRCLPRGPLPPAPKASISKRWKLLGLSAGSVVVVLVIVFAVIVNDGTPGGSGPARRDASLFTPDVTVATLGHRARYHCGSAGSIHLRCDPGRRPPPRRPWVRPAARQTGSVRASRASPFRSSPTRPWTTSSRRTVTAEEATRGARATGPNRWRSPAVRSCGSSPIPASGGSRTVTGIRRAAPSFTTRSSSTAMES